MQLFSLTPRCKLHPHRCPDVFWKTQHRCEVVVHLLVEQG